MPTEEHVSVVVNVSAFSLKVGPIHMVLHLSKSNRSLFTLKFCSGVTADKNQATIHKIIQDYFNYFDTQMFHFHTPFHTPFSKHQNTSPFLRF